MRELYLIATNADLSLDIRYDAVRLMQHKRDRKVPFWKFRVLQSIVERVKKI